MSKRAPNWSRVRLHVVSGKGGTGKTTVAAALALALAKGGKKVLLLEVEGRQGIAQLFDTPPLPYQESKVAVAEDGGVVYALPVDPEDALLEYLEMFYGIKRGGYALRKLGAIDFATTIAPGVRDVLLTGKASEAVKRGEKINRPAYDAVVMDAPPTGRITRFLNVNTEIAGLAKVGPIRSHADSVMGVIRSARTAVHLVTLLEEMPVQETLDGIADLQAAGLPLGAVIINQSRHSELSAQELAMAATSSLPADELRSGLRAAGIDPTEPVLAAMIDEAADHAARVALQDSERERLAACGLPLLELPLLSGGVDLAALYSLADALTDQGLPG
ncbi:MAG: AAA family ATPase [Candidatus Nanopelagicales bacterium]|nr:AAA family ATPase [Candidatus Nanopelagicales bacterium]MCU0295189.1 AAA family ATPase [Candidatus Nanopelagicales bacterium]MCU0298293.1 AAA family ATPase [Candidatus Nanopelagicales bacterium]